MMIFLYIAIFWRLRALGLGSRPRLWPPPTASNSESTNSARLFVIFRELQERQRGADDLGLPHRPLSSSSLWLAYGYASSPSGVSDALNIPKPQTHDRRTCKVSQGTYNTPKP